MGFGMEFVVFLSCDGSTIFIVANELDAVDENKLSYLSKGCVQRGCRYVLYDVSIQILG